MHKNTLSVILTTSTKNLNKYLTWQQLNVAYRGEKILNLSSLKLMASGWNCIIGSSGAGKSTLLKAIAGLIPHSCHVAPKLRSVLLSQQDSLLPWLSVWDNVLLGSRLRGEKLNATLCAKAEYCLQQTGLEDKLQDRPHTLSGGMRARVALARTLMEDAPLVLLDEPFAALDALTRLKMQQLSFRLLSGRCVLLVTHDPLEALRLGHSVQLLRAQAHELVPIELPALEPMREFSQNELGACYESVLKLLAET